MLLPRAASLAPLGVFSTPSEKNFSRPTKRILRAVLPSLPLVCLWNMHVADAYVVALGGAPGAAVMER